MIDIAINDKIICNNKIICCYHSAQAILIYLLVAESPATAKTYFLFLTEGFSGETKSSVNSGKKTRNF